MAQPSSIQLEKDYSPLRQLFAIPVGDRRYEYVDETPQVVEAPLANLRTRAYEVAVEETRAKLRQSVKRERNKLIRSYALERSKGVCEACEKHAPFTTKNGQPYLEVHHIDPVAEGGADSPLNVAAVCPNCHRRTEKSADSDHFNDELRRKIAALEEQIG